MTGFKLSNVKKSYGDNQILCGIDLDIESGTFVSIVGASGCGKSTLLRLIAGLDQASSGQIVHKASVRKSFVFQDANLLDWRNVFENARLAFELDRSLRHKFSNNEISQKVNASLQLVQLEKFAGYFPHELSGGMKMRNSIARALASEPQLLLMDEPFAALDDGARFELQIKLREIAKAQGLTVVFVTHNIAEAVFLSDQILQIKEGHFATNRPILLPAVRGKTLRTEAIYHEELQKVYKELL